MSHQEVDVIELLQRAAREVVGRELPGLTPSSRLAETGLDSVAVIEMVGSIEDQLGIRLPDEEIARIVTVADVAALIERTRAEAG